MRESFYKSVHFHFLNLVSFPTRLSSSQHPENREIWLSDVLFQASGTITFYSNRDKHYLLSIVWKEPLQWKGHWPWVNKKCVQKMPNITYMYIVFIFSPSTVKWNEFVWTLERSLFPNSPHSRHLHEQKREVIVDVKIWKDHCVGSVLFSFEYILDMNWGWYKNLS